MLSLPLILIFLIFSTSNGFILQRPSSESYPSPTSTTTSTSTSTSIMLSKNNNNNNNNNNKDQIKKRLILIRHGRTHMNEYLSEPGSQWGDDGFTDVGLSDELYRDSPLSEKGIEQARGLYSLYKSKSNTNQMQMDMDMDMDMDNVALNDSNDSNNNNDDDGDGDDDNNHSRNGIIDEMNIDLVVVSPLTRAFQTLEYGLFPHLNRKDDGTSMSMSTSSMSMSNCNDHSNHNSNHHDHDHNNHNNNKSSLSLQMKMKMNTNRKKNKKVVPIITQPLASERVYLISDHGLPMNELKIKFPYAEFNQELDRFEEEWWFTVHNHNDNEQQEQNQEQKQKQTIDKYNFNSIHQSEYEEWRPNTNGQTYACKGEPDEQFNQRMYALYQWLDGREETTICLISHWGVLDWLTGVEFENCELKEISFDCVKKHVEVTRLD